MTDDDYDALSQKQLASIKRDMRISLEDAAVRATHKVVTELEQEPVASCNGMPAYEGPLSKTQRTWVGLTDEEAQWLYDNCRTPSNLIDMTEAKLKEKNT
jgi:hypothetical protein